MTITSERTSNPIRAIVDNMKIAPNPAKPVISLALGDPTVFGNFNVHKSVTDTLTKHLISGKANGYPPAHGMEAARAAIAKKYTVEAAPLTANDVIIASGCSGAIDLCITAMANPGQTILLPRPGFPLYQTLADSKGIKIKYYNLDPKRNWEIDLVHLESLIDSTTAFILINNPSNPCGSNFSRPHLESVLALAEKHYLPILADEIYADMVFEGQTFTPLASIPSPVPVVSVGGLAKRWLVPGWRVGWILVHDRPQNPVLGAIRTSLLKLSQLIIGANSVIQAALPEILHDTPQEFYDHTNAQLEKHAKVVQEELGKVSGLQIVVPQGAMYVMVGVDVTQFKDIPNDIVFTEFLMAEESVMALPGQCFGYPNFFRIVTCPVEDKLREACRRIAELCARHHV
ncbi:tyrosine aminotransferase [Catenaria anguillulae PL171]|uniref:Tyrosine aminotransferase n=1 Tax=Catenaria anguillulae PL171 TaxID=765915 RepID=A0A1Y2HKM9_9FUNG|nr:tyrosine aminotransferase [Catenaria anguillulae PL171]